MIDEAQDLNPVMRAIGEASGARLFPVGDPWQQIYTWRGAEDALERLPGERLYLSQSFRFGEAIAEVARRILASKPRFAPPVDLRGSAKQSRVGLYRGQRVPVLLCRGNTRLLKEATAVAKAGLRPHIIGGLREIAEELREAWLLYAGRRDELPESSHFVRFEHWRDLVEETRQLCDQQMEQLIKSVEEGLVQDLRMLEEMHVTDEAAADVVLSTAHRAKGREWSTVALADDFPGLWRLGRKYDDALDRRASVMPALEEWHVLYVAATRAVDCLLLPPRLYQWLMDAS
jgi:superfamily I DNA/RNA helicase